jgi:hypothetical protein
MLSPEWNIYWHPTSSQLSAHPSALTLQIWQQAVQPVRIGRWNDGWVAQVALPLARLMRQLMAHERMLHLIFSGCRLAETLGGASFGLQLWHNGLEEKSFHSYRIGLISSSA